MRKKFNVSCVKHDCRDAFSLMEMMIVLLIVAIIAAATAPMVTKKLARNSNGTSGAIEYFGLSNHYGNNGEGSLIIGDRSNHGDLLNPGAKLYIDSNNNNQHQIGFGVNGNYLGLIDMQDILDDNQVAIRIGTSRNTVGKRAIAIGHDAQAAGHDESNESNAVAIGAGAQANSLNTIAIGAEASAEGNTSIAIGTGNRPSNQNTRAEGNLAIAIGQGARANWGDAIALGTGARNGDGSLGSWDASSSIAIGRRALTTRENAISIGNNSESTNLRAISIGAQAKASGQNSIAIGYQDKTYLAGGQIYPKTHNKNAISIGTNSVAGILGMRVNIDGTIYERENAIAIGAESNSTGYSSVALGPWASASETCDVAIGSSAKANKDWATALGVSCTASGLGSTAVGSGTIASGNHSIAIGNGDGRQESTTVRATGANAIAIGAWSGATAENSVAIGAGVVNNRAGVIQLGTAGHTVYIPGNLVVGGHSIHGLGGGQLVFNWSNADQFISIQNGADGDLDEAVVWDPVKTTVMEYMKDFKSAGSEVTFAYDQKRWVVSDRRLKNVGEKFKGGLEELKKLDLYNYTLKKDEKKKPQVGVIAQDLQKVFPTAVWEGKDGYLRIRWDEMFYAVINAVKELDNKITAAFEQIKANTDKIAKLQAQVDEQKQEIKELKAQNADFEKRLAKLEKADKKRK